MGNDELRISKIKNIYIMLLSAISNENIDKVDHYLDDCLTQHYRSLINDNIKRNVRQKFDQLNISEVKIIHEDDNYLVASAITKYYDYFVNRKTGKIVGTRGSERTTNSVELKFRINSINQKKTYKCPNCGASLNLNEKSFCDYCGKPVDERFSELILTEIHNAGDDYIED